MVCVQFISRLKMTAVLIWTRLFMVFLQVIFAKHLVLRNWFCDQHRALSRFMRASTLPKLVIFMLMKWTTRWCPMNLSKRTSFQNSEQNEWQVGTKLAVLRAPQRHRISKAPSLHHASCQYLQNGSPQFGDLQERRAGLLNVYDSPKLYNNSSQGQYHSYRSVILKQTPRSPFAVNGACRILNARRRPSTLRL